MASFVAMIEPRANNQAALSPSESLSNVELRLKALGHLIRSQKPETAPLSPREQDDINHGLGLCLVACAAWVAEARQAIEASERANI